jgi:hypothetical protein
MMMIRSPGRASATRASAGRAIAVAGLRFARGNTGLMSALVTLRSVVPPKYRVWHDQHIAFAHPLANASMS